MILKGFAIQYKFSKILLANCVSSRHCERLSSQIFVCIFIAQTQLFQCKCKCLFSQMFQCIVTWSTQIFQCLVSSYQVNYVNVFIADIVETFTALQVPIQSDVTVRCQMTKPDRVLILPIIVLLADISIHLYIVSAYTVKCFNALLADRVINSIHCECISSQMVQSIVSDISINFECLYSQMFQCIVSRPIRIFKYIGSAYIHSNVAMHC